MIDRGQQETDRAAGAVIPGAGLLSSSFAGYFIALVAVLLSWLLRLGLTASFGEGLPTYTTFYPAVILAALLGGWAPGLFATGLATSSVAYGLLPPAGFAVMKTIDMIGLLLFFAMCLSITRQGSGL